MVLKRTKGSRPCAANSDRKYSPPRREVEQNQRLGASSRTDCRFRPASGWSVGSSAYGGLATIGCASRSRAIGIPGRADEPMPKQPTGAVDTRVGPVRRCQAHHHCRYWALTVIAVPFFESVVRVHSKDHPVTIVYSGDTLTTNRDSTLLSVQSARGSAGSLYHSLPLDGLARSCGRPSSLDRPCVAS